MPVLIRAADNQNTPIVEPGQGLMDLCFFNLVRLADAGARFLFQLSGCECACVVLSGTVEITVGRERFENIGSRADVWSGRADSVYAPLEAAIGIHNSGDGTAEVAVVGGLAARRFSPFRVTPEEVDLVDVGSPETHSRRRIFHILGQNAAGRVDRLLVSERYTDGGCWSGYPPHKHDTESPPEETDFEEVYHFRFRPESGFGAQLSYAADGSGPHADLTRHGDTFLIDRGHHPTVTSPGHDEYALTLLVGRHQRSLIQFFDPQHGHLMKAIPGIQAMRDKFRQPR